MSTKKKGLVKEKQASNLMYLGPTITGVVRRSTSFKNGVLTQKLKECIAQYPAMKKLFVSTEEIPTAVKELNKEQSYLKTIYNQVAKKFK